MTVLLLGLGVAVFYGADPGAWYARLGLVPRTFWADIDAAGRFWQTDHWFTPLTAISLHLDWLHLLGNLAFFLLFAQRIERRLGWVWFLVLVAGCGAAANLLTAWQFPASTAPIIGASGATAALLGAFLVLYPTARLGVILPLGVFWQMTRIPGPYLIGSWFLIQLVYTWSSDQYTAIAWWSHIGGFAFGLMLAGIARIVGLIRR